MRLIKMFGVATIAAVAAMAFVGASVASATSTALCTVNVSSCPVGNQAKTVHYVSTNMQLLPLGLNPITCKEVLISGEVLALGSPQPIHFSGSGITYSDCETFAIFHIACTVTVPHFGLLDLLKTAANLGELTDLAVGGKFTEINFSCTGVINCTFKGEGLVGHALGAPENTTGSINYAKSPIAKVGGTMCPDSATLDGTFISLTALFITG